jgi:hypothetical protein
MIETAIRRCLQGRGRFWILITLFCGVSVMVILPGTDEYNDSRECRARLAVRLAEMRQQVGNIDEMRRATAERQIRLGELDVLTIPADDLHVFRQEIVTWARNSGCQVRRIHVNEPASRPWRRGDSLSAVDAPSAAGKPDSLYVLNSWPCSVSISGTLAGVTGLLNDLESSKHLIASNKMSLRPTPEDRERVVMDLELTLFNLSKTAAPSG